MALLICRCCGGTLEQTGESTLYACRSCGMHQTAPRITDEQRRNLFDRAEQLRATGEFDRAAAIYEQMTTDSPGDPELWWALLLCRYGITYVADGGRAVPTINRARRSSILADQLFRNVMECSAGEAQELYRRQAGELEAIQSRLLALSDKEQPFDIFICYKEDDGRGGRTYESLLAQEVYKALSAAGRRVFFARISLEEKPGIEYEPYIFSALNSARVMIVIGFTAEHFNAPWVRNEWSRYLALMDESRLIIPVVSGDISVIPAELSGYQAVDSSQIGFLESVIAASDRVLPACGRISTGRPDEVLHRAYGFLGAGDYAAADKLAEQLLDLDPENGAAYTVKLLAALHVQDISGIAALERDISDEPMFRKAIKYCSSHQKNAIMEGAREAARRGAVHLIESALQPEELVSAAEKLQELGCDDTADECRNRAAQLTEKAREQQLRMKYDYAADILENSSDPEELSGALDLFASLGDYENSPELAERCRIRLDSCTAEQRRLADEAKQQSENRQAYLVRRKRILIASLTGTAAAAAVVLTVNIALNVGRISSEYSAGISDFNAGSYQSAAGHFRAAGDHRDSREMVSWSDYYYGLQLQDSSRFDEAAEIFSSLGDFENSAEQLIQTKLKKAIFLRDSGEYDSAVTLFRSVGDEEQAQLTLYRQAEHCVDSGNLQQAASLFEDLGYFSDSHTRLGKVRYAWAEQLLADGEFSLAKRMFLLSGADDREERVKETRYREAEHTALSDKEKAADLFSCLEDYSDSAERAEEFYYEAACDALTAGKYEAAETLFSAHSGYADSQELLNETRYRHADMLFQNGDYSGASDLFSALGSYSDSAQRLEQTRKKLVENCAVGSIVEFGRYIQDNDTADAIKWVVASNKDGMAMLISLYILDQQPFGGDDWESSSLRSWLNGAFLNSAFTAEEQQRICPVRKNYYNELPPANGKEAGTVSDLVTIPGYSDWRNYMNRYAYCTPYAEQKLSGSNMEDYYWIADKMDELPLRMGRGNATITLNSPESGVLPIIWISIPG